MTLSQKTKSDYDLDSSTSLTSALVGIKLRILKGTWNDLANSHVLPCILLGMWTITRYPTSNFRSFAALS